MRTEFITIWQRDYGGLDHREVWYEEDEHDVDELRKGCQRTVENHGGMIHLYEINNDGTVTKIDSFGSYFPRSLSTEGDGNPDLWRETRDATLTR